LAAVLFTSGATGPAKGVRYTHGQLSAQRDAVIRTYGIGPDDAIVAAFAPFALCAPALGVACAVPDMDITRPGTLTAPGLADACGAVSATVVFAAPAALVNVQATRGQALRPTIEGVRILMSAGAPVPRHVLDQISSFVPGASVRTPYGMTEMLPVTDVALADLVDGHGVVVGRPVAGAQVRVLPLGFEVGQQAVDVDGDVTGELFVTGAWCSDGYDGLWDTEQNHRFVESGTRWHRSGDVGHLDHQGRVWVEGRLAHVVWTADGPVTPVPIEVWTSRALGGIPTAAVGIGPVGAQVVVVVIEDPDHDLALADPARTELVRGAVTVDVAAVCTVSRLPVDIRHNSKVDRTALGRTIGELLDGR
jgi:acyl-coenzyme A synthetase/AMP-(fatty) acid ligase